MILILHIIQTLCFNDLLNQYEEKAPSNLIQIIQNLMKSKFGEVDDIDIALKLHQQVSSDLLYVCRY